jgi:hypothetical protein
MTKQLIQQLESKKDEIIDTAYRMLSIRAVYTIDMLAQGIIQHSLSNISAFCLLVEAENYLCAFSMVRMQLDALLRFFALSIVEDPHDLAKRIIFHDDFHKIKVSHGDRKFTLTATFLCHQLERRENIDWIERVYKESSRFIHPTGIHFFSTIKNINDDTRESIIAIHKDGKIECPPEELEESVLCMIAITNLIIKHLNQWVDAKSRMKVA